MNNKTRKITTIAMLCAITYIVMVVGRIPVVLFLKYDPSDVIVTLGGLIWGPMNEVPTAEPAEEPVAAEPEPRLYRNAAGNIRFYTTPFYRR